MSDQLVKRARITNYRTSQFVELALNPNKVSKKLTAEIAEDKSPGFADPLRKWSAGGGADLEFSILVHSLADLEWFDSQVINYAQNDFLQEADGYSIAGQLEFYEQFMFPSDPDRPGGTGATDHLVFSMGRYFRAARYLVASLDIDVTELNPDLDPTVAEVKFSLKRYESEKRFANDIYNFREDG